MTGQEIDGFLDADDMSACLLAADEVAYRWSISEDRLTWSASAREFFAGLPHGAPRTGRDLAALLAERSETSPYDTIVGGNAAAAGVSISYTIQYQLKLGGAAPVWVEDCGRWLADGDGRPSTATGIIRQIDARHQNEERMRALSERDPLTGTLSQVRLAQMLEAEFVLCQRERRHFAFLLASVDNLATINGGYGFDIGDEALIAVTARIRRHLRGRDDLGRFTGNKFGVLLRNCNTSEMAIAAQRLIDVMRTSMIETSAGPIAISLSVGGALGPRAVGDSRDIIAQAHEALSESKAKRRGTFVAYDPQSTRDDAYREDGRLGEALIRALNENRVGVACQPIVRADSRDIVSYEALMRIAGRDGETLSPALLVPVAERLGLCGLLDHRMLELALNLLDADPALKLALNISARTTSDPHWLTTLADRLIKRDDMARRLVVEMTESAAILDIEESARFLEQIKTLGCRVAIDDFGAGHTSFRYLREMKVDAVKIDGSYITSLSSSWDNQIFVRTMIGLARELGIKTVAEWVDNEADARLLESWGIDFMQGHLFGNAEHLEIAADDDVRLSA